MTLPKIVVATSKSWNIENARRFQEEYRGRVDVEIITGKANLTVQYLQETEPDWVFFPHWSWIIPDEIISRWQCVIFHTSPLPWGRGGSPIQNQIVREAYDSEVCAVRAVSEIDAGPIYTRSRIDLSKGTVEEILIQVSEIVFKMISAITLEKMVPLQQEGDVVAFKRRNPEESRLPERVVSSRKAYDHLRMLDGEDYPPAFLQYGNQLIELNNARLHPDGTVTGTFRLRIRNQEFKHE